MRDRTTYNIHPSGGLLSTQFLQRLRQEHCKEAYTEPETFTMNGEEPVSRKELDERIARAWKTLLERWDDVSLRLKSYDVPEARGRWIMPLLRSLGYDPVYLKKDTAVPDDDLKLALSHRGGIWKGAPFVHTVAPSQDLDEKIEKGRGTKSPHDTLQIHLNRSSEDLWGIVTNGIVLRVLRKYYHTYTKGYIEFDLESIFEERSYSDFLALYRMAHPTRFLPDEDGLSPLEHFYKKSLAAGEKIGDDLRENVKAAIEELANGLMSPEMAERFIADPEACKDFYREILHVIYRIMFLMFAEQRGMLPSRDSLYAEAYSMTRLRERVEKTRRKDSHHDAWEGLLVTFEILGRGVDEMGVFGYNGGLFDGKGIETLRELSCENTHLLKAVEYLAFFESEGTRQRISYVDLGVEEIGSIYESLLDYVPRVLAEDAVIDDRTYPARRFFLDPRGAQRKSTGSYYTDPRLVNELIKSALQPVAEDRSSEAGDSQAEKEKALLSIKVCDPATGSGAFLIAANNYLARELAKIRTGTEYPSEREERRARRDVLQHCIYGVDLNPMAVELAKVSLWINASVEDMPLNFLDHHIKCGNSIIGSTPKLMAKGIPDDAFEPAEGDDKEAAKEIAKRNKAQRKDAILDGWIPKEAKPQIPVTEFIALSNVPEAEPMDVEEKKKRYERLVKDFSYEKEKFAADFWTAAFFWPLVEGRGEAPTHGTFRLIAEEGPSAVSEEFRKRILELAHGYRFFHWHLEFPEVFTGDDPGFDCVLGNPPWERVKLQEKEFFEYRDEEIANALTKAKREQLIEKLRDVNPPLYGEFRKALRDSDVMSKFFRGSGRFELSAKGDINYYPLFAELNKTIINNRGRVGMVIASGIATDYFTQDFLQDVMGTKQLASLYDFENREKLFPGIDSRMKFSLLTLTGKEMPAGEADFAFYLSNIDHLQEEDRHFTLTDEEIELLNPNTKTCPIFRSKHDAELTKKIYRRHPVMIKEKPDGEEENHWGIKFATMFHMSNDSHLFKTKEELEGAGFELDGNFFRKRDETYLPLYEGKMIWHYDHRFASFSPEASGYGTVEATLEQHQDPNWEPMPRYWVSEKDFKEHNPRPEQRYLIGFRNISNTTNERTCVSAIFPNMAVGHSMPLIYLDGREINYPVLLTTLCSSMVFDYFVRQKMGGTNFTYHIVKQLPIISPSNFENKKLGITLENKCLTLFYTSHSLTPFARDLGYNGPPFKWDPEERTHIMAELDAIVAHLYGVTRDELDYILETFPIVRRKDEAKYGECRTKRLILEYFDKYEGKIGIDAQREIEVRP